MGSFQHNLLEGQEGVKHHDGVDCASPIFSAGKWCTSIPGTSFRNVSHITSWESLAMTSTLALSASNTLTIARVNFPVPEAISKSFMGSFLSQGSTPTRLRRNRTDSWVYSGLPFSYSDKSVANFRNPLPASAILKEYLFCEKLEDR